MGILLGLLGFFGFLFGLVNVIYPIKQLGVKHRPMGLGITALSLLAFVVGIIMTPSPAPADKPAAAPEAPKTAQEATGKTADAATAAAPAPAPAPAPAKQAEPPKPVEKPYAEAELTEEIVTKAAGIKAITKVEIIDNVAVGGGKKNINVYYDLGTVWDETDAVKRSARQAIDAFEKLFANPNVAEVGVWSQNTFTDQYGKESVDTAVRIVWSRETAAQVEWKNFKDMVLVDFKRAFNIADNYYIHPGVLKNVKDRGGLSVSGGVR